MKYPASRLTPFPPTFLRIPRRTHIHPALCLRASVANPICRSFVFMVLQIPFPATLFLSHPYKTPGGVTLTTHSSLPSCVETQKCLAASPLLATLTHSLSRNSFPCHSYANTRDRGATPPKFFSPLATRHSPLLFLNTFRMNTCKSVSKQRTLTPFRMNTCEKTGGGRTLFPRLPSLSVAAYTSKLRGKTPCSVRKLFAPKCAPHCSSRCRWCSPRLAG
jgi:hypothetical protein